jgi:hypothetical protein
VNIKHPEIPFTLISPRFQRFSWVRLKIHARAQWPTASQIWK